MFAISRGRLPALPVYWILEGASALFFQLTITIYAVYYASMIGMTPFQIVMTATLFETTIFLFEVPTGIVADLVSRRLSIIIGVLFMGMGLLIEGLFPTFGAILLAQVIAGIGVTFTSGATQAWITDEIGERRANRAFLRAAQIRTICAMLGMGVSVAHASVHLRLPFLAAGSLLIGLGLFLIIAMPETHFRRTAERATWRGMFAALRQGLALVRYTPVLLLILAIEFIFAFHTEGFDNLWQNHLIESFTLPPLGAFDPVFWFGVIGIGANLASIALHGVMLHRINFDHSTGTARALMLIYGAIAVLMIAFALAGDFLLAVIVYMLIAALRGVVQPVSDAWLNQHLEPSSRATMFSLNGQIHSVGEMAGGLPIGLIGTLSGMRAALFAAGMVLSFTLPLFAAALKRERVRMISR